MRCRTSLSSVVVVCLIILLIHGVASVDYGAALTKTLLYYEGQRSGKLPPNQRVQWRGDSGLTDGNDSGIDLIGGYYDAGDNVKFGFPMAFTITMLSWGAVDFRTELTTKKEFSNVLDAIRWGTDYLIKAHPEPHVLYGQVGDGDTDHACWQRPEDMTTPRTAFKIDEEHPGSDLAAETAAALAAASVAFSPNDSRYSSQLLTHAKQLFEFAQNFQDLYQNSIPAAGKFYSSSGFEDELIWAAAWLHRATGESRYVDVISESNSGDVRTLFAWDDKFVGAQLLIARLVLDKTLDEESWGEYKYLAEEFICNTIQKGQNNFKMTPGGLLWFLPWNNLQYTATATFVATVYSQYLALNDASLVCSDGSNVQPSDLVAFAQSQVDYILGENPLKLSYMVGFGSSYPLKHHHRGSSIVSIKKDPAPVSCQGGYDVWFNTNSPNPNALDGAIVGGPDENDGFQDSRSNFQLGEPTTTTPAPLIGVLARL